MVKAPDSRDRSDVPGDDTPRRFRPARAPRAGSSPPRDSRDRRPIRAGPRSCGLHRQLVERAFGPVGVQPLRPRSSGRRRFPAHPSTPPERRRRTSPRNRRQREPRGGLDEFLVAHRLGHLEGKSGDDLTLFEGGGEHVQRNRPPRSRADRCGSPPLRPELPPDSRPRVVVGQTAADGATIADRRIADADRQRGQRRVALRRLARYLGRGRRAADHDVARLVHRYAAQFVDARKAHQP